MGNNSRNKAVDILRIVGTFLVVLAHVNPPEQINELRSFDVCLLVFLSGFCYKPIDKYSAYCIKRVKRLCLPAWVCATITFVLCGIICLITQHNYVYSTQQIIETYLFLDGGIGLLWIVRIYMLMALIAPGLDWLNHKIQSDFAFFAIVVITLIVNQLLCQYLYGNNTIIDFVVKNYVTSAIAYSCVYGIGMRIRTKQGKSLGYLIGFLLLIGLCLPYLAYNGGYRVAAFKYPPQSIYIVISLSLSLACWQIISCVKHNRLTESKIIQWLSAKSFDIYLSHALMIYVLSWGSDILNRFSLYREWWFRYVLIICGSLVLTFIWDKIKLAYFKMRRKH